MRFNFRVWTRFISPTREKVRSRMMTLQNLLQWLSHNPLSTATVLYIAGVISVLVYAYFEPQDQA